MKLVRPLLAIWVLFLFISSFSSCSSAEKAANERRNFMMPKTSELKRNGKYQPAKAKKTYKPKKVKKK
jgi:hypothetical protein